MQVLKANAGGSTRTTSTETQVGGQQPSEERESAWNRIRSSSRSSTPIKTISPILPRCIRRQSSEISQEDIEEKRRRELDPTSSCRPGSGGSGFGYDVTSSPSTSSPARVRRAAIKRMSSLWSSIKTSSPVRRAKEAFLASRSRSSGNQDKRSSGTNLRSRYSYSHPDVSCSNLANLAFPQSSSRDDMALLAQQPVSTSQKYASLSKESTLAESTALIRKMVPEVRHDMNRIRYDGHIE